MGLSNSAARLTTRAVVIAPSHHRRLRVRNVNIDARMPQPDRAAAVGRLRVRQLPLGLFASFLEQEIVFGWSFSLGALRQLG